MDILDCQFYPTPRALASRAWAKFQNRDFQRVLEPSAGAGDLALAAPNWYDVDRRKPFDIDVCELNVEHHPLLREKGFNVVGVDFLGFQGGSIYSHIIMNGPFESGVHHVLKAWDVLWDGEIVAIVNAETVRNPFSKERQLLVQLIEQSGSVEFIEGAFMVDDAARSTPVEIALIYLKKSVGVDQLVGNLIGELSTDSTGNTVSDGYQDLNFPALQASAVSNMVTVFRAAVRAMRESVHGEARAGYYAQLLGDTMAMRVSGGHDRPQINTSIDSVRRQTAKQYGVLKDRAWSGVLRSSSVLDRLSSEAQKRVEREFASIKQLEFNESNIYGFLAGISASQGDIQLQMACDVFDLICRYHSDNTVFYRGWKSNDKHHSMGRRIRGSRFILPYMKAWRDHFEWDTEQRLRDIDKVFAMLDGKSEPAESMLNVAKSDFGAVRGSERVSSTYFSFRFYKGVGTIHFYANSLTLVDRLNRLVGRHRQWLPPEHERVNPAFWLQYDKAEKLDKSLRREVAREYRNRYDDPFHAALARGDSDEGQKALALIDQAARAVHTQNGIGLDYRVAVQGMLAIPDASSVATEVEASLV